MKDKTARALAITALVFMGIFVGSLPMSFLGTDFVYGVFVYTAVGSGAAALLLFVLLKIDGRGFSMSEINNEIELKKIERENEALLAEAQKQEADKSEKTPEEISVEKND